MNLTAWMQRCLWTWQQSWPGEHVLIRPEMEQHHLVICIVQRQDALLLGEGCLLIYASLCQPRDYSLKIIHVLFYSPDDTLWLWVHECQLSSLKSLGKYFKRQLSINSLPTSCLDWQTFRKKFNFLHQCFQPFSVTALKYTQKQFHKRLMIVAFLSRSGQN